MLERTEVVAVREAYQGILLVISARFLRLFKKTFIRKSNSIKYLQNISKLAFFYSSDIVKAVIASTEMSGRGVGCFRPRLHGIGSKWIRTQSVTDRPCVYTGLDGSEPFGSAIRTQTGSLSNVIPCNLPLVKKCITCSKIILLNHKLTSM